MRQFTSNSIPIKLPHVGSFLLLVFLSTFNATSVFEWWKISLEPITFLALILLLVYKVHAACGFKQFVLKFKVEIGLIVAYQLVSLFTLWTNLENYESNAHALRFGLHFIVLSSSMPAALWLFSLESNSKRLSLSRYDWSTNLVWLWFLAIAILTVWQVYDYQSSKVVSRFFVGSEIWPEENINSVFRINTDLGTILSLSLVCFLILIRARFNTLSRPMVTVLVSLCIACFIAGISTGSRNFLLTFFVGFIVLALTSIRGDRNYRLGIVLLCLFVLSMHIVVLSSPYALLKLSSIFPYLRVLSVGEVLALSDLIPNLDEQAFAGRMEIWKKAVEVIQANPLFGVSNGVSRELINPAVGGNSHNFILQILLDAGLVGFLLFLMLVGKVLQRLKMSGSLLILAPVLCMLLTALSFDYYLDHSLPWILSTSYFLAVLNRESGFIKSTSLSACSSFPKNAKMRVKGKYIAISLALCLVLVIWLALTYVEKNKSNHQLPIGERLVNITSYLTQSSNDLIFVDDRLSFTREQLGRNSGWRFNRFDLRKNGLNGLCHFALPGSAFLLAVDKQRLVESGLQYERYYDHGNFGTVSTQGFVTIMAKDISCDSFPYDEITGLRGEDLFSNRFDNKDSPVEKQWSLWANIDLTSKILTAQKGNYQLSFTAEGRFLDEHFPQLKVEVLSLNGHAKFNNTIINIGERKTYTFDFTVKEAQPTFFKMSFINDFLDDENIAIFINPETIRVVRVDS